MLLRLGTRSSLLARWQADWVAAQLRARGVEVELVLITTQGDVLQQPIGAQGDRGLFTREIQRALLDHRADLAVHSLKDLPTDAVPGLALAAVPERAAPGDVLVSVRYASLDALPAGATVGTGSLRRRAQLLHRRPDLAVRDIRGNVDTRLAKLDRGEFDAVILAAAGLERLGRADRITQRLPTALLLPAIGQGALGIEARADDQATRAALASLDHPPSHRAVLAERAMLAALHGGCLAPIAAWGRWEADRLLLTGRVLAADGAEMVETTLAAPRAEAQQAENLGRQVAAALLAQGAGAMIAAARGPGSP